jgi:hypothetical protein
VDLEILGSASSWLSGRVRDFCGALENAAWGPVPPARLVIAKDYADAMRRYLPPSRYEAWVKRQEARGQDAFNIGMGFTASDGKPTAIVAAMPEATNRNDLLGICCHELCELATDSTDGEDHQTVNAAMSGLIWSEHVVERRRTEVFVAKDWSGGVLDRNFAVETWDAYRDEFPELIRTAIADDAVPDRLYGHWQILTREVTCGYGRAAGGFAAEQTSLNAFLSGQPAPIRDAWLDLMLVCDEAYDSPAADQASLDELGESAWIGIYEALRVDWNDAYMAAQV